MTRPSGFWLMDAGEIPPAYLALAAGILWPERPRLVEALEIAYGWSRHDAEAAAANARESEWGDGTLQHVRFPSAPADRHPDMSPGERLQEFERRHREAVAHLSRAIDPDVAWERLVPASLREAPDRWFFGETIQGSPPDGSETVRTAWGLKALHRSPPTLAAVLAVAGDPEGFVEAEALAREVAARLAPWGASPATRILWHIDAPPALMSYRGSPPFRTRLSEALDLSLEDLARGDRSCSAIHPPRDDWRFEWQRLARQDVLRAEAWREACARCRAVPDLPSLSEVEAGGGMFGLLPDPHEPLLRIWKLGYAFEAISDGAIILAAGAVTGDLLTREPR
jgi:hypothetical protein